MSSDPGNRGHRGRSWKGAAPFDLHTPVSKGKSGGDAGNSPWGDRRRVQVSGENSSGMQGKLSQLSVAPPSAKLVSDESIGSDVPPKRSKSPYASSSAHSQLVFVESTSSPQLKQPTPPCFPSSVDSEEVSSESTSSFQCDLSASSVVDSSHPLPTQTSKGSREGINHSDVDHLSCSAAESYGFDICYTPTMNVTVLKRSLFQKNREKRLQAMSRKNGLQHQRLRPGMFLLEKFLTQEDQIAIIRDCRSLGVGHGGFYKPGYDNGAKLQLQMMCLGKNWNPVTNEYESVRSIDDAKPPQIPDHFKKLVEKAMEASQNLIKMDKKLKVGEELPAVSPDLCIVNFYSKTGKLGLHQDKDESPASLMKGLPVVSFSIGDSADFLYGDSRNELDTKCVKLESGDVLIFGGKSRHVFHGVSKIHAGTAPENLTEETNLKPGRLNLTFRQY